MATSQYLHAQQAITGHLFHHRHITPYIPNYRHITSSRPTQNIGPEDIFRSVTDNGEAGRRITVIAPTVGGALQMLLLLLLLLNCTDEKHKTRNCGAKSQV